MQTKHVFLFLAALCLSLSVGAHAPKKINLKYNKEKGELNIDVVHPVKDVVDHHIETILITVNGEDVKTLDFKEQTSKESEDLAVSLPDIKSGDEISVKAVCNKFGSKTESIGVK